MALKDIRNGSVPITLDKPRHIRFDLNALVEIEEAYGSMDNAFAAMKSGSMKAVRTMLWAGLIHEDEELTLRDAGRMVTPLNVNDLSDALSEALSGSLPEDEDTPNLEVLPTDPT